MSARKGAAVAVIPLVLGLAACEGSDDAAEPRHTGVLSASQVHGEQTGSGTDLLQPAAKSCPVDGPFLWGGAGEQDVRAFTRTVDGHSEDTVVATWPMPEKAALTALGKTNPGPECNTGAWTVESVAGVGQVGGPPTSTFEVRKRDAHGNLMWWSLRTYAYAHGHMIAVWAERTDSRPSIDGVRALLRKQKSNLGH